MKTVCVLLLMFCGVLLSAQNVAIPVEAAVYIGNGVDADKSHAEELRLRLRNDPEKKVDRPSRKTLLRFPIPDSLPEGDLALVLTLEESFNFGKTFTLTLHAFAHAGPQAIPLWSPEVITWNNAPAHDPKGMAALRDASVLWLGNAQFSGKMTPGGALAFDSKSMGAESAQKLQAFLRANKGKSVSFLISAGTEEFSSVTIAGKGHSKWEAPVILVRRGNTVVAAPEQRTLRAGTNGLATVRLGNPAPASSGVMDAGAFLYQSHGVEWGVSYPVEAAAAKLQGPSRWTHPSNSPFTRNTVTVDGQLHRLEAVAKEQRFRNEEGQIAQLDLDMSEVLGKPATRSFALLPDGRLMLRDRIAVGENGALLRWAMACGGEPQLLDADHAVLQKGDHRLHVRLLSPMGMAFSLPSSIPSGDTAADAHIPLTQGPPLLVLEYSAQADVEEIIVLLESVGKDGKPAAAPSMDVFQAFDANMTD